MYVPIPPSSCSLAPAASEHLLISDASLCLSVVKNENIEGFWEVFKQFDLK